LQPQWRISEESPNKVKNDLPTHIFMELIFCYLLIQNVFKKVKIIFFSQIFAFVVVLVSDAYLQVPLRWAAMTRCCWWTGGWRPPRRTLHFADGGGRPNCLLKQTSRELRDMR
jgi:hypothetical protein